MTNQVKKPTKTRRAIKALNIRMPYDLWAFMKQCSIEQEISVNEIINKLLTKMKDKKTSA